MARHRLELIKCDRCQRENLQPVPEHDKLEPDFVLKFKDKELIYKDLCLGCERTVRNVIEDLEQWDRKVNSLLKDVDEMVAPPLQVPPSYTPPKPHSPGAVKK